MKTILITGAGQGLGNGLALELAGPATHLVLLSRHQGRLEKLDDQIRQKGGTATLIPVDLAQDHLLDQLAAPLLDRFQKLDALILNAAHLTTPTPTHLIKPDDFNRTMLVNLHSNWRLLRALTPLLQAAPNPKVLFMTCKLLEAYNSAYAASKAGSEAMLKSFALENRSIGVEIVDPGPIRTKLYAKAFPGIDPLTLPTAVDVARGLVVRHLSPNPLEF